MAAGRLPVCLPESVPEPGQPASAPGIDGREVVRPAVFFGGVPAVDELVPLGELEKERLLAGTAGAAGKESDQTQNCPITERNPSLTFKASNSGISRMARAVTFPVARAR
jgi:hypothetical protein